MKVYHIIEVEWSLTDKRKYLVETPISAAKATQIAREQFPSAKYWTYCGIVRTIPTIIDPE